MRVYPPRNICTRENPATGDCQAAGNGVPVEYEGAHRARERRRRVGDGAGAGRGAPLRAEPLGVTVAAPIARIGTPESPLGNLFADAVRASTPGADVAIGYGAGRGGIRADLPAGPLTFGAVYDAFPFDNRVMRAR